MEQKQYYKGKELINIHSVLTYLHLTGQVDLSEHLHIADKPKFKIETQYKIGYGIYKEKYTICKNNQRYFIISNHIAILYKKLKKSKIFKKLGLKIIKKRKCNYSNGCVILHDYKLYIFMISEQPNTELYDFYYT